MADKVAELSIGVNVDTSGLSKLADSIANGKAEYEDFAQAVVKSSYKAEEAIEILKEKYKEVWKSLGEAESYDERAELLKKSKNIREAIQKLTENSKLLNAQQKQLSENTKNVADNLVKEDEKLKRLTTSTIKFLGQYFAVKKTFSAVMGFAKEGEELARLADLSGTSAQSIERLGIALKNYGGSASSASSTLSKLNKQMEDLKFGKGGKLGEAAVRYGLDVSAQSPEQMLLNIAKRMEGLGATQQVAMGKMLGLDNATLLLVTQGVEGVRKELEKASELQVFSKEDIENSQKLNRAYRELEQRWNQLKSVLNRGLLPVFQVIIERLSKITKYFNEHPKQIKAIATIAGVAFGALFVALSPFTALFAAIGAGIALLIDDFVAFKQGGESALKPIWEWIERIGNGIMWVGEKIRGFIGNLFGGAERAKMAADQRRTNALVIGAQQLAQVDAFAGNTMTSSAIANSYASNQTSQSTAYHIGQVMVLQKNNENAGDTTLDWTKSLASGSY